MAVVSMPKKQMDENEREARYAALAASLDLHLAAINASDTSCLPDAETDSIVSSASVFLQFLQGQ
jgi:hypothetical protein